MKKIIIFIYLFLISWITFPQVINIEKIRKDPEAEGFHGLLEMSLDISGSENDVIQFKNQTNLGYISGRNTILVFNDIGFGRIDNENFINDGFQHVRYKRLLIDKLLSGESFVQFQYNSVRKLRQRWLIGLGPRFTIFERDSLKVFTGTVSMLEFEVLKDNTSRNNLRMSSYISFFINLDNGVSLNQIIYYLYSHT